MFKMPECYVPPLNTPVYWRNEVSGVLAQAVWAFIKYMAPEAGEEKIAPTQSQLDLVIEYLRYFIDAPCWSEIDGELGKRRNEIRQLKTPEEISAWIDNLLDLGIDPL